MRRWYFWVLAPICVFVAVTLPFTASPKTVEGRAILYGFSAALLLGALGLAAPRRFRFALKGVALLVLLGFIAYVGSETWAWLHGKPFGFGSSRGASNLWNALRGLTVFGIPALLFLIFDRSGAPVDAILDDRRDD